MVDGMVLIEEETQKDSLIFLLVINGKYLETLKKENYKIRIGARNTKVRFYEPDVLAAYEPWNAGVRVLL